MSSIAIRGVRTGKAGDRATKIRKGKKTHKKCTPAIAYTPAPKKTRARFLCEPHKN